jgi:hypothetical protein
MVGRDNRSRPPILEFVHVNRPASDLPLASPCPPGIPLPDFVPAVPPANRCRPRGFSPPRRFEPSDGSGFVAPQYRTGFAVFRTPATRAREPWPYACLPRQRHSHPSKISPRWQPYRITAAVASSTFAEYPCLSPTSQPARLSCTLARFAHRVRRPTRTPNGCSPSPFPERVPATDRRPSGHRVVADTPSSRSHLCSPTASTHLRVSSQTDLGAPTTCRPRGPNTAHLSHPDRLEGLA